MGGMRFFRMIQRAFNMRGQRELANLETLLEREAQKDVVDYRLFSYIVPGVVGFFGVASLIGAIYNRALMTWQGVLAAVAGLVVTVGLAAWSHVLFKRLHKSVPPHRARIHELATKLHERYSAFQNVVGFMPALAPDVAEVLDAGAGIYLKHAGREADQSDESTVKAREALEAAMAKLLELGQAESSAEQQIELARGWALPLLEEMAATDHALDRHDRERRLDRELADNDPLTYLRASRVELQESDTARTELDQRGQS